jgi:hypothetical protein
MHPFDELLKQRSSICQEWASTHFAGGGTFRIFAKGQSQKMRRFLNEEIGDGQRFAACKNSSAYSRELERLVRRFQKKFRTNSSMGHRPPNFGQAAKVINLYVKALLQLPPCLFRLRDRIERHAHVTLDNVILGFMWGSREKPGHFHAAMRNCGTTRRPALSQLDRDSYFAFQGILADSASKRNIPPSAYDYFWVLER